MLSFISIFSIFIYRNWFFRHRDAIRSERGESEDNEPEIQHISTPHSTPYLASQLVQQSPQIQLYQPTIQIENKPSQSVSQPNPQLQQQKSEINETVPTSSLSPKHKLPPHFRQVQQMFCDTRNNQYYLYIDGSEPGFVPVTITSTSGEGQEPHLLPLQYFLDNEEDKHWNFICIFFCLISR